MILGGEDQQRGDLVTGNNGVPLACVVKFSAGTLPCRDGGKPPIYNRHLVDLDVWGWGGLVGGLANNFLQKGGFHGLT